MGMVLRNTSTSVSYTHLDVYKRQEHGRPVLKVIPIRPKLSVQDVFGDVQGQLEFLEDMNAPTIDEWSEV